MQAPIRLIATRWLYDQATRTLFSSDMFTHVWRAHADRPWIVTEDDDTTSPRELRSFMLNTRYWWLEGAPTDSIRRGIADVFEKYDVETIAPGYGCVLEGEISAEGEDVEAEAKKVQRTRSPEFDDDCSTNSRDRPHAFRYAGGTHPARNLVGKRDGCKNRDVGVGWNSACCP